MTGKYINWRHIAKDEFEALVEALVVRDRTMGRLVGQAVDGRGGDGGIDIDVRVKSSNELVEILQLKFFPEGFSNGFKTREKQIKKSFTAAMKLRPRIWTLVIPANFTPSERKRVEDFKGERSVRIQFLGVTELNLLLAKFPEIHTFALRDPHREALALVGRETAALSMPGDLANEVQRISSRTEGKSAYWGTNFAMKDGIYTEEIYAKRPDATEREPLSFTIQTQFGKADEDLRRDFEDSLGYGILDTVVLPPHIVTSFTKIGPSWFAGEGGPGELRIMPADSGQSHKVNLVAFDSEGRRLSSINGRTGRVATGPRGVRIECIFPGGLREIWKIPLEATQPGTVELIFKPTGFSARDIQRVLRFIDVIRKAARVTLSIDGKSQTLDLPDQPSPDMDRTLHELIDDLAYIENSLDVDFDFPAKLPDNLGRVWIRVVRRMLEGRAVVQPRTEGITITLKGSRNEELEAVLTDEGGALVIGDEDWTVEILGQELFIGSMGVYHPHLRADNARVHLEALLNGDGVGREVHLTPADGEPFVIYSPARIAPGSSGAAEPWNLTGIPEHRNFSKLTAPPPHP